MNPAPKRPDDAKYSGRFAIHLRALREAAGLTGQDAAKAITKAGYKVAQRSYYAWEAAQNEPPLDAFPALAKVFKLKKIGDLLPDK
ncbi:MAG: helix-turn-helix transcriptional regulator [Aureliella sp.]